MYTYIKLSGREKIGHRYAIQYRRLKVLSPANIKTDLDLTFIGLFSFKTIKYYVTHVERGCTSGQNEHRSDPTFSELCSFIYYYQILCDLF